jgi:two-component system heavy metal sensor histidine kinase CusS
MSSTIEPEDGRGARQRRPTSIAFRMTLAYALFSFTLIFITGALLYFALVNSLYQEDVRDLADNLNNARLLLRSAPSGWVLQPPLKRPSWAPPEQPQIYLRVLDERARVLAETPGMAAELPPPTATELARRAAPEGAQRRLLSRSGKPFLTLIERVPRPGTAEPAQFIEVGMDREHDEALLQHYRKQLWLIFGASLVICSLAGYLIAKQGIRPIAKIAGAAAHIRSSTLHERIEPSGLPAELAGLAATFNGMLDRLEQSFAHVSQLSDNVAHELRTPINNLRGEIEVALSKPRLSGEYHEILASCLEECTRIGRLIQTLLFLARSDMGTELLMRESIDVAAELAKVEEYYGAAATEAGVTLRIVSGESLRARLNRTLFQQAVGNLVSNAIAHTPAGGSVTVAAGAEQDRLMVRVSDTGCGIPPEHLPHVFDRFYRVDRARGGAVHNVGLGLAVVKSIAARHGGHVEIDSEVERGTEVRLLLPA